MINNIITKIKGSTLINSAIWYTVGNFLLKGINFLTIPIFTRLLSPYDYGITTIYYTWGGILSILIGLGVNGTIGSAKVHLKDDEYDEYLSSILFLGTLSFIFIFVSSLIFGNKLTYLFKLSKSVIYILILQSFFSFVVSFISTKYTFDKDYKKYLVVSFLVTIINVITSILFILSMSNDRYLGRIYGGAISTIIIGSILYIKIMSKGKKLFSIYYWKFCLPIAIPIIFHNLSHMVLSQADRIMLQQFTNETIVGLYGFTYNIAIILNIVNMSINNAWVAWYFDALKNKVNKDIKEKAKLYIILFTIFTSMFLLGAPEIIKIIASKNYWDGIDLIPIIILGYYFVFLYTFGVNYEFYKKKTKYIAIGTLVAATLNIVINFILIPITGMYGAAIATLISYIILFIMHEFIVRYVFKHKDFPFYYYIYSMVVIGIITLLTYIFIKNIFIRWMIILLILFISIFLGLKIFKKNSCR